MKRDKMRFSNLLMAIVLVTSPLKAATHPAAPPVHEGLSEITIGSPEAPIDITMYFAPTCTHCADFENDVFPEIEEEFITTGQVRVTMRLTPFHRLDYTVAKLAWGRGLKNVIKLIKFFLAHQKEWLDPVLESPKKRAKLLQAALEEAAVSLNMSVEKLRAVLNIDDKREDAFIKLFALHSGFTIEEIEKALQENLFLEDELTANHLRAAKDFGKPLTYVPAFLVNGKVTDSWPNPKSLRRLVNKRT